MANFDPSQFGATPVANGGIGPVSPQAAALPTPTNGGFDPSSFGATPVQSQPNDPNNFSFDGGTGGPQAPVPTNNPASGLMGSLGQMISGAYKSYSGGVNNFMDAAAKEGTSMLGGLYDASAKGFGGLASGLNKVTGGAYPDFEAHQVMTPDFVAHLNQSFPGADAGGLGAGSGKLFANVAPYFLGQGEADALKGVLGESIKGLDLTKTLTPILGDNAPRYAAMLEQALGVTGRATIQGTQTGLIGGLENGLDPNAIKNNFEYGFGGQAVAEGVSGLIKTFAPNVADALQKSMLKMSPAEQRQYGSKVQKVVNFLNEEKIIGTPTSRYQKVDEIYSGMEEKLQTALTSNPDLSVSKNSLIDQLNQLKDHPEIISGENGSTAEARAQIDKAIQQLQTEKVNVPVPKNGKMTSAEYMQFQNDKNVFKDNIPLTAVNDLKRGFYSDAYNEKGTKVLDTINKYIGDIFKGNIEHITNDAGIKIDGMNVADFNAKYGTTIDARRILNAAQYKPQTGTGIRAIAALAPLTTGAPVINKIIEGSITPKIADFVAGSLSKSLLSSGLEAGASKITPGGIVDFGKMFAPGHQQQ